MDFVIRRVVLLLICLLYILWLFIKSYQLFIEISHKRAYHQFYLLLFIFGLDWISKKAWLFMTSFIRFIIVIFVVTESSLLFFNTDSWNGKVKYGIYWCLGWSSLICMRCMRRIYFYWVAGESVRKLLGWSNHNCDRCEMHTFMNWLLLLKILAHYERLFVERDLLSNQQVLAVWVSFWLTIESWISRLDWFSP